MLFFCLWLLYAALALRLLPFYSKHHLHACFTNEILYKYHVITLTHHFSLLYQAKRKLLFKNSIAFTLPLPTSLLPIHIAAISVNFEHETYNSLGFHCNYGVNYASRTNWGRKPLSGGNESPFTISTRRCGPERANRRKQNHLKHESNLCEVSDWLPTESIGSNVGIYRN